MRNLLIVTLGYPTATSFSGAFHRNQFQLIAQAGFKVTVVAPTPWVPPLIGWLRPGAHRYSSAPMRQVEGAVEILRPRYPTVPDEARWFYPDVMQYIATLALRLPRPDIIQGFYGFPNGAAARRLALHWGVPYLVGLLGDDVNLLPKRRKRNRQVLRAVVRDAAVAFANGQTLAAKANRITGIPVMNLPIGVDASRFVGLSSREQARAQLGLPADKTLALYVGSLLPAKGIGELIAALEILRDDNIAAVAIGDGAMRERLCSVPNAICLGVRSPQDVALAMIAADYLVHPSHSEGLPIAVLEAAFAGLPIITTDAPGCIDLGRDGRASIVAVGDSTALARAMREITRDREGTAARAEAMLTHVREHYSLSANTARLVGLYGQVLSQQDGARH
jgi:glycosyltransferase involved in cell wall biosynthesis